MRTNTNRAKGVGDNKLPVISQYLEAALENIFPCSIIDLGAGIGQHIQLWRKLSHGLIVTGTDLPENVKKSDGQLININDYVTPQGARRLIISSNVINIQETPDQLENLCLTAGALGGHWLVNYPLSPRKMGHLPALMEGILMIHGWVVKERYNRPSRPVWLLEKSFSYNLLTNRKQFGKLSELQ